MSKADAFLQQDLKERRSQHRYRSLPVYRPGQTSVEINQGGKTYLNFSSNDYLGLATHPKISRKSQQYVTDYGNGSTASRLICGTFDIHTALENTLAKTFDREAALVFNSGFQANSSILGTVTNRHSLILADKLSHNSLLQGSLSSRAGFQRFNHNDVDHLAKLLKKARNKAYERIWVVTESVFSMDGDRSPLHEIAGLCERYNSLLFVDDAHAVGVWGADGLGLAPEILQTDILLGTCGKAFGSFGAYVACSQKMKDYLINFCPGFIYTTALPPAVIGATQAALELIPDMHEQRKNYHQKITMLRNSLQKLGFDTGASSTQIIPVIIGDDENTLGLMHYLHRQGILATAIRPPTVPKGEARLRLTLSSRHTSDHIDRLLQALKSWDHG